MDEALRQHLEKASKALRDTGAREVCVFGCPPDELNERVELSSPALTGKQDTRK